MMEAAVEHRLVEKKMVFFLFRLINLWKDKQW